MSKIYSRADTVEIEVHFSTLSIRCSHHVHSCVGIPETEHFEEDEDPAFAADIRKAVEESLDYASWGLNVSEQDAGLGKIRNMGPSQLVMESTAAIAKTRADLVEEHAEAVESERIFQQEMGNDMLNLDETTRGFTSTLAWMTLRSFAEMGRNSNHQFKSFSFSITHVQYFLLMPSFPTSGGMLQNSSLHIQHPRNQG